MSSQEIIFIYYLPRDIHHILYPFITKYCKYKYKRIKYFKNKHFRFYNVKL